MAGRLEGKVVLITGAGGGQGRADARLFVEEGARVVLTDVADEAGADLAADLGHAATYVHHDVGEETHWDRAVTTAESTFGRLDVLVNNAGIMPVGRMEDTSPEGYMAAVRINQLGCFLGMAAVAPALRRAGGGSIVNISSVAGLEGTAGTFSYSATKWAVRGMTKCAALELGRDRIRVNSVHPGGVDTPMIRTPHHAKLDARAVLGNQIIPRPAKPIEVAHLVLYLASDESIYCTGSEFTIDGGYTTGHSFGLGD